MRETFSCRKWHVLTQFEKETIFFSSVFSLPFPPSFEIFDLIFFLIFAGCCSSVVVECVRALLYLFMREPAHRFGWTTPPFTSANTDGSWGGKPEEEPTGYKNEHRSRPQRFVVNTAVICVSIFCCSFLFYGTTKWKKERKEEEREREGSTVAVGTKWRNAPRHCDAVTERVTDWERNGRRGRRSDLMIGAVGSSSRLLSAPLGSSPLLAGLPAGFLTRAPVIWTRGSEGKSRPLSWPAPFAWTPFAWTSFA